MSAARRLLGILVLLGAASTPAQAAVKKPPYLLFTGQNTSMDVMWQSTITESNVIRWGTSTSYELGQAASSEFGSDHQHRYTLFGLTPDTVYYYQVDGFGTGFFRTAPPTNATAVSLWAISDSQFDPAIHESVIAQIRAAYTAAPALQTLVLHAGDWAMDDTETTWNNEFFLSSSTFPQVAAQLTELPMAGARGNHEGSGTRFKKYLPFPYQSNFYWSFDYGPVHVTVIDNFATYTAGSAEYNWIVNDLASTTRPWKIVIMHEPGWSAGGDHENNTTVQAVLHPLFEQYRVDVVLNGHNHYYARAVVDGIQYLTIGGAGGELMPVNLGYPNIVKAVSDHNYLRVDVAGSTLTFTASRSTGAPIETVTLTHDAQPPTVSISAPVAGATVSGTVALTATATDDVGVTAIDFYLDGSAIGSASGSQYTMNWNTSGVANGNHTLVAHAYDARGNVGISAGVTITVSNSGADTQAPTVTITAPAGGAAVSGNVAVTAAASDNVGVTRVELYVDASLAGSATASPYSFSWNSTNATNGAHALTAKAYDAAGNVGTSAAIGVTVGNPLALANGVTVTFSGARKSQTLYYVDVPTGSSNLRIALSGGTGDADLYTKFGAMPTLTSYDCRPYVTGNTETCSVTTPSAGRYYVMVNGYAAYTNATLKATFAPPDATPPTVSITAPATGAAVSGNVAFSASASDNVGVTRVEFYVDGTLLATDTTSPYGATWSTTSVANGSHTLSAKVYDAKGNVGASAAVSVTVNNAVDTQPPTASITAPANGATVNGSVTFSASASDNVRVAKVEFYVDGALLATDTTSPYSTTWATSSLSGSHTLSAKAYDDAGNAGTSAPVSVAVNNGTPLTNGVAVTISGALNSQTLFYIDVPGGASNLVMALTGGTGDADLYTRAGSPPTTSRYDCRPYVDGNEETCTVAAPSATRYFLMIRGYGAYASVTLRVSHTNGD